MTDRTIRIVQRCTTEEAAAMVAAIRAYEEGNPASARAPPAAGPAVPRPAAGPAGHVRRDGVGVLWTRSDLSTGRGF